jgi:hypothetical protein
VFHSVLADGGGLLYKQDIESFYLDACTQNGVTQVKTVAL